MKKKSDNIRERDIEKYLVKRVKKIGGWCPKWIAPGYSGVPDRIVFFPNGQVIFVELKAPGKKPTKLQRKIIHTLRYMKQEVLVIDSKELVDLFIETVIAENEKRRQNENERK